MLQWNFFIKVSIEGILVDEVEGNQNFGVKRLLLF